MGNQNINCNVDECQHNSSTQHCCMLNSIQVTKEASGPNAVPHPHYCQNFELK